MAQVSPEAMIELLQTVNKTQFVQIDEQTKTIKELRELVAELRGTIANLEETVHEFKRKLFGSSSEILHSEEEAEEEAARECPGKKEAAVTSNKRKYQSRTSRKELYKNIPIEEVKIDIPEEKRFCPDCNASMKHLGYKYVREEVHIIPAKVVRIHYYKETLYCPSCRQFELACNFSVGLLHKIYQYLGDGENEIAEFKIFFEDFVKKRNLASHDLDMI